MTDAVNLTTFVGDGILSTVGSELLLGIIILAVLIYWAFKSGAGLGTIIVITIPIILILSSVSFGYFPDWLFSIVVIGVGILFSGAIIKLLARG